MWERLNQMQETVCYPKGRLRRDGWMERMKKGGGGVVAMQLKKDWITAARKVSANTNSPWAHSTVWLLSEHPHPSHSSAHTSQPTAVSTRKITCMPIYRSLPALHTIWPLEIKCIYFHWGAVQRGAVRKNKKKHAGANNLDTSTKNNTISWWFL